MHSNSDAETIVHVTDVGSILKSIYSTIMKKIWKYQAKCLSLAIDSVMEQKIIISNYKPLSGSSYINWPKELNHSRKSLTNIQNGDYKEWLKWSLVRHLHPVCKYPARITKIDKDFTRKCDLKDILSY